MSTYLYADSDNSFTVQSESGFGCHQMTGGAGFHAERLGAADQVAHIGQQRIIRNGRRSNKLDLVRRSFGWLLHVCDSGVR